MLLYCRFHSDDKNVVCPDCGVTVNKCSYKRHTLLHKQDCAKCDICNKRLPSQFSLERHLKKHAADPNFGKQKNYRKLKQLKQQQEQQLGLWKQSAAAVAANNTNFGEDDRSAPGPPQVTI